MPDIDTAACDERRLRSALAAHRRQTRSQLQRWRTALVIALYAGDLPRAHTILRDSADEIAPLDIFDEILTPALHDIGALWERNEIGIADEHVATTGAHRLIPTVAASLAPVRPPTGAVALLAAPPSERHTTALLMVEAVVRAAGYRPILVGSGVPIPALADAVRRHAPTLVALTTTICAPAEFAAAAQAVLERKPDVRILVGGGAARPAPASTPWEVVADMRELARLIEPVERERAVHGAGAGATACIASLTPRSAILQEGGSPGADPLDEWVAALDLTQWEAAACRRALLRVAEQRGRSGSWAWDLGSGRIVWSENMFRILGFAREDGVPSIPEILDRAHPADRAALAAALERAQRHQELPELTYRVHTATGQTRFLHADRALRLPRTGGGVLVGWLRDATEERESERLLALRSAVTAALVCCHSTDGAVRRLLAALGSTLGFGRGALMLPAGGMLHVRAVWAADDANAPDARRSRLRIRRGQGLAGRAWEQAAVLDARELTHGPRMRSVPGSGGIRVALALPIPGDGDALGVIELAGSDDLELTARLRGTLAEVAEEIGTFLGGRMAQLRGSVLSPREIEVLELAAGGLSGPAIAARLHLSPSTVKTHFENVYAKYEVPDRVAAVAKALREGLIR